MIEFKIIGVFSLTNSSHISSMWFELRRVNRVSLFCRPTRAQPNHLQQTKLAASLLVATILTLNLNYYVFLLLCDYKLWMLYLIRVIRMPSMLKIRNQFYCWRINIASVFKFINLFTTFFRYLQNQFLYESHYNI